MHTNWCVLIEMSMELGMLNFWLGLLVTAQTKENYFSKSMKNILSHYGLVDLRINTSDKVLPAKEFCET